MTLAVTRSLPRSAPSLRPQILLVDDDPGVRRSLQLLLEGEGYGVRAFANAAALLADPRAGDAACLVTDYRLGESDGLAMLTALRTGGWSGPAILMTAFASPALAIDARRAGFAELFDKPLRPHQLVQAIGRLLARD